MLKGTGYIASESWERKSTFPQSLATTSSLLLPCPCLEFELMNVFVKGLLKERSLVLSLQFVSRSSVVINGLNRGNSTSADGGRRERIVY